MSENQQIFESRREAKWQFRRALLLEVAKILEERSDQVWPDVSKTITKLLHSASPSIQKTTKRWLRFAGRTPEATLRTIRSQFEADTPEGVRRQKLQDLSDGHPFSGILPEAMLRKLRESTNRSSAFETTGAKRG